MLWRALVCVVDPIISVMFIFHSLWNNQFTDAGKSQLRQAAEKRNNDQANYVRLDLGV